MIKLATWNVNGIRACVKNGFKKWIEKSDLDIICLQETKITEEFLKDHDLVSEGYYDFWAFAQKKGYSGTALFSRVKPLSIHTELGKNEYDIEGRTIIAEYKNFFLINGYFPNGQADCGRVPYKLAYSREIAKKALELKKKHRKEVIVCGDINSAHMPIDLKNPKTNQKNTGFLPIERAWIDEFTYQGFNDVLRYKYPEKIVYSFWSRRFNSRAKNVGWRLDYFFATDKIVKKVKDIYHQTDVYGSDHCPVILELNEK